MPRHTIIKLLETKDKGKKNLDSNQRKKKKTNLTYKGKTIDSDLIRNAGISSDTAKHGLVFLPSEDITKVYKPEDKSLG